jgi:small nuclear ribonucleoprotein (snRNP)-like protein
MPQVPVDTESLEELLFQNVRVQLNANREIEGKLVGLDRSANIVLSQARDCKTGAYLHQVWVRGNGVVALEVVEADTTVDGRPVTTPGSEAVPSASRERSS